MGATSSKSKQYNDNIEHRKSITPTTTTFDSSRNSSFNHSFSQRSEKSIVHKFQTLYKSTSSNSERIINDQLSDSSKNSFHTRTKKLFKKRKSSREDDSSSEHSTQLLVSSPSALDDPMTAAIEKLSARFDQLNSKPSSPCSTLQRQFEQLDYNQDIQQNQNMSQCNNSQNITPGRPMLAKQDSTCEKINKNWLSSNNVSKTSQDIVYDIYLGSSNESDRRKEKDRQQRLHYLLKYIWKGIYRSNIKNPKTIVHWCCGIGVWDMEMALLFPDAKVIGVDFEGASISNLQHDISNLEFRNTLVRNKCTGLESFESNSVDFVIMRDVWLINAPVTTWNNVLEESFRILKPGGWIELVENTLKIESQGPRLQRLDKHFADFLEKLQIDRSISLKLGGYLENTGFVDVDESSVAVPLGEWCSPTSLKEIGYLNRDVVERRIKLLSKWVNDVDDLKGLDVTTHINETLDQEIEFQKSYINWVNYTARKPPVA